MAKMKQVTLKIVGFVTVTVPADDNINMMTGIPVKLDVFDSSEHEDSLVEEVIETEIITKEIQSIVDVE